MSIAILYILSSLMYMRLLLLNIDSVVVSLGIPLLLLYSLLLYLYGSPVKVFKSFSSNKFFLNNLKISFLFLISSSIVFLQGGDYVTSLMIFFKQILILCCFIVGYLSGECSYKYSFKVFVCFLAIYIASGIMGLFMLAPYELVDEIIRPIGFAGASEVMGHLSMFAFIFFLGMCFVYKNKKRTYYPLMLMSLILLLMSSHLKNIFIALPSVLLLFWLFGKIKLINIVYIFVFSVIAITLGMKYGGNLSFIVRINELFSTGISLGIGEGDVVTNSGVFRIIHWKMLFNDWYQNYFIFGVGAGNIYSLKGFGYDLGHRLAAHSDVVTFIVELGVLVFPLFLYYIIYNFWILYKISKFNMKFKVLLAVYFSLLGASFAGGVYFSAAHSYLFWFIVGLFCANYKKRLIT